MTKQFICDNCEDIYSDINKLHKIEKNTYLCDKCYKELKRWKKKQIKD